MDLFGKKAQQELESLKEELAETQKALEETEQALERYRSKFRNAETEKQEAHKDRKDAEQRLQNLKQSIDSAADNVRDTLPLQDLEHVLSSLEDIEFMTAHAYTAYLPPQHAVFADDTDGGEIIFFDPYTTGVVLYPPVPVKLEQTSARTFQTGQLETLLNGTYLYVHLSEDGSGAAIIQEQDVTDHVLQPDAAVDSLIEELENLQVQDCQHILVTGDDEPVTRFTEQLDQPVNLATSKLLSVNRKTDLKQAFTSAFTVECRRLTDEDIEQIKENVF